MIAEVEQPDGSYKLVDMEPPSDCFFCDTCGDCLRCQEHDPEDWCRTGGRWVIYLENPSNPNKKT